MKETKKNLFKEISYFLLITLGICFLSSILCYYTEYLIERLSGCPEGSILSGLGIVLSVIIIGIISIMLIVSTFYKIFTGRRILDIILVDILYSVGVIYLFKWLIKFTSAEESPGIFRWGRNFVISNNSIFSTRGIREIMEVRIDWENIKLFFLGFILLYICSYVFWYRKEKRFFIMFILLLSILWGLLVLAKY